MTTEQKFLAAVDVINSLPKNGPFQPSEEMMLKFNAYYKQATKGSCTSSRPSFFDHKKQEWYAWKSLGNMSKEEAMEKYVQELLKVVETMSYTEAVSNFIDLMGPFYEIVWPGEVSDDELSSSGYRQQSDEQEAFSDLLDTVGYSSNETSSEMVTSTEDISDEPFEMLPQHPVETNDFVKVEQSDFGHCKRQQKNFSPDNINFFINGVQSMYNITDSIHLEKQKVPTIQNDSSTHEILSQSVLNLQKSLDSIIQHLDSLENLAKKCKSDMLTVRNDESQSKSWKLSPFTLGMVIFWPFIVHWIVHVVQQRRNTSL